MWDSAPLRRDAWHQTLHLRAGHLHVVVSGAPPPATCPPPPPGHSRLVVAEPATSLEDFHPEAGVSVRFVDSPPMRVEGVEVKLDKEGEFELILVLPSQPTDSAVDSDMIRLCEKVMRGESTIFQVRFGMDLMEQCNARTSEQRLRALSMYFAEAKRRVDEVIRFGREAGRVAQGEAAKDDEDDDFEAPDRRRGGPR